MFSELVYFVRPCFIDNFTSTFTDVSKAGIRNIVLASRMGEMDFLNPEHAKKAKSILKKLKLNPVACHGLLGGSFDLNETENSSMLESHLQLMTHIAEMGCKTYVCHPGQAPEGIERKPLWDNVRKNLDHLAPHAESLGLIIAIENANPGNLGDNAKELFNFIDRKLIILG